MGRTAGMAVSLMASTGMSLTVVRALNIRIVLQVAVQKRGNLCICISAGTAIQLYTGFRKSILRTASDTAADQRIHLICFQQGNQQIGRAHV